MHEKCWDLLLYIAFLSFIFFRLQFCALEIFVCVRLRLDSSVPVWHSSARDDEVRRSVTLVGVSVQIQGQ